jgi:colanic acid biosynthesis glycosyl transferase WcaI
LNPDKTSMAGQPKTIVIISLCYWPEKAGGAPPVQQMAEALARSGTVVTVITARPSYPEMAVFPEYRDGSRDRETHNGVAIIRLPAAPQKAGGGPLSILKTEGAFALGALWHLIRMPRPDTAIAVCPSILAVAAMRLGLACKVRCVAVVHDIQSGLAKSLRVARHAPITRLLEWLERITLNRIDHIVTLSHAMTDEIRGLGVATPISIIPPTVDDDLIQPLPEQPGAPMLLYSGNIGRKQGLEQLLDLADELQRRRLQCTVVIRGDGNYREALQRSAEERALNNVRFEPLRPTEQLAASLAEGHLHLVPQNPAGAAFAVPSKIYSIMAAGRPFVCTAEPGSPLDRLRAESNAFVTCPPNQPGQLTDTVERLMADPAERTRLGQNGRAYVERYAGKAACTRAYRALLASAETPEIVPA